MVYDFFDKYTFLCEMYVEEADKMEDLILNFFPFDNSVQIVNPSKGKSLLKRTQLPTLALQNLQVGNVVAIFSKLLHIKDCAPLTTKKLFPNLERTFIFIKPTDPSYYGRIITYIEQKGFRIYKLKNGKLDKNLAVKMYGHLMGNEMLPIIIDYVTSGEVIGMELIAPDGVQAFRECLGATDPKKAEPGTLRQLYGKNMLRNVAHGSHTAQVAREMSEEFFGMTKDSGPKVPLEATMKNCSCCVIKPHAILEGHLGHIVEIISSKFHISAMSMFAVDVTSALEFFEIYKGVLSEYEAMAVHLAEGRCVALEVKSHDPNVNVVEEFRKLCGPRDPMVCRQLFPDTIRALYGKDLVHNAVHCTDLLEDGELEVEYFFNLLTFKHKIK